LAALCLLQCFFVFVRFFETFSYLPALSNNEVGQQRAAAAAAAGSTAVQQLTDLEFLLMA
jgi:hypothetical protein